MHFIMEIVSRIMINKPRQVTELMIFVVLLQIYGVSKVALSTPDCSPGTQCEIRLKFGGGMEKIRF